MRKIGNYIALGFVLVTGGLLRSSSAAPAHVEGDDRTRASAGLITQFTVTDKVRIPGKTLSSGDYTLRMVDRLTDRMILRVEKDGKAQSTFLALPKSELSKAGSGPILFGTGSKLAMRGFALPNKTVVEFVYPKAEAVTLAKANNTTVPAIDPASEGRPPAGLSQDDLQEVTLWLLTPTLVGPEFGGTGIKAARYQAAPPTQPQASPVQQAQAPRFSDRQPAPQQVASVEVPPRPRPRKQPLMSTLPHTASEMPLAALIGVLSMMGAGLLMRRRLSAGC